MNLGVGARRRRVAVVLLGIAVLAAASPVWAHRFKHPKVMRVGVRSDRLLLSINYDLNPGVEAHRARALFDRNSDGELNSEEQDRLAKYLIDVSMMFFHLSVNGSTVAIGHPAVDRYKLDRSTDATSTLGVALLYDVPLPAAERTLEIVVEDRDKDRTNHVPLVVDLAADWHVGLASQGELHPDVRQIRHIRLQEGRALRLALRRAAAAAPVKTATISAP